MKKNVSLHRWFLRFYGIHLATFVLALVVLGTYYGRFLDRTSGHLLGDLFQVTLKHLESELNDLPKSEWVGAITQYQIELGTPVHVRPIKQYVLSDVNLNALRHDEIVMVADSQIFLKQLEGTDLVLALGPIDYLSFMRRERSMEIISLSLIALLLGIPAYLAIQPLARDLGRLDGVARELSRGELKTRAALPDGSPIQVLGETFNTMAANLEALDQHRKNMISIVSHELRLPIARLRYRLDWIQSQAPDAAQPVAECSAELDALADLVDELLLYSRLQQPELQLKREVIDCVEWVETALARFDIPAHLRIETQLPPHEHFEADRTYIDRALLNLIGNAFRYARSRIAVTVEREGPLLRVMVDDDGPGIPPEKRQPIFEPFSRFDDETAGYGLGLAIVRQILHSHGGRAWAEDSPLGGARLILQWRA